MKHRWAACALLLAACALNARRVAAQTREPRHAEERKRGTLGQNQPNPFTGDTTIPFTVGDSSCAAGSERHVVTLRVYNILSQIIAAPTLADSSSSDDSSSAKMARPLMNLALPCGSYTARWDGTHARTKHPAAGGVYMYQLVVDGHATGMRKMLLKR